MKIAVLCVLFISAATALPKRQNNTFFRSINVKPLVDSSSQDVDPRITGGKEATPHSIPFQAFLTIWLPDGSGWDCGGSLISSSHILTAAHCLLDAAGVNLGTQAEITLGAHNIRQDESSVVKLTSKNLIPHPDYNRARLSNDIGIIVLGSAVSLNDYINTVPLPSSSSNDYVGANARVSGWGLTSGNGGISSVLMEVYSPVISNAVCRQTFDIVIDSQICTVGSGAEGHCEGDSGGPLTADGVLIGVVSYGAEGCPARTPSAYTRVTSYLSWINQHTSLYESGTTIALGAEVTLGTHNIRQQGSTVKRITSSDLISHPDYNRARLSNDIGIIVLSSSLSLNEYINTVPLPSSSSNDYVDVNARVSGWGLTTRNGDMSPVLREVYSASAVYSHQQICTLGSGAEGHCEGDSGGPLNADGVLIGVVSYGAGGCPARTPSGYSRVTSYLSWISQHIGL